MTDSGHVEEQLGAYLDAELDAGERAAVETHLHDCSACRDELAALGRVHAQLRLAEVPSAPETYWQRFAARVDARLPTRDPEPVPWGRRVVGWFVPSGRVAWTRAAAALASVTLLVYVGLRRDEVPTPAPLAQRSEAPVSVPPELSRSQLPASEEPAAALAALEADADRFQGDDEIDAGKIEAAAPPASKSFEASPKQSPVSRAREVRELMQEEAEPAVPARAPEQKESPSQPLRSATVQQPQRTPGVASVADEPARVTRRDAAATPAEAELRFELRDSVDAATVPEFALAPTPVETGADARMLRKSLVRVSDDVRIFVSAALARDADAAEQARRSLAQSNPSATLELQHMKAWSNAAPPAGEAGAIRSSGRLASAPRTAAALQALDALIWPRRRETGFQSLVARMATELEQASAADPEQRARARAYLAFLAENATTDDERAAWQRRLEALAP
jgi:hypothetical protein